MYLDGKVKKRVVKILKNLIFFLVVITLLWSTNDGPVELYQSFHVKTSLGLCAFVPVKASYESVPGSKGGKTYFVYFKYKTFKFKETYSSLKNGSVGFGGKNVDAFVRNKEKVYRYVYVTKSSYLILDKEFPTIAMYQIYLIKRIITIIIIIGGIIWIGIKFKV